MRLFVLWGNFWEKLILYARQDTFLFILVLVRTGYTYVVGTKPTKMSCHVNFVRTKKIYLYIFRISAAKIIKLKLKEILSVIL